MCLARSEIPCKWEVREAVVPSVESSSLSSGLRSASAVANKFAVVRASAHNNPSARDGGENESKITARGDRRIYCRVTGQAEKITEEIWV
jgi:hypothetical protein